MISNFFYKNKSIINFIFFTNSGVFYYEIFSDIYNWYLKSLREEKINILFTIKSVSDLKKITILHTNDVHSHIDPFPGNDPVNPNGGGVIARSNLINSIKKENANTLVLDAGDVFQGTPYFNYYGGELEFKLMSMMQYDASTIGNHDFDNGIDGLRAQMPHATF